MTEDTARFQTLMNQGHSAAWDQDWDKASEFYRQALEEIPDHPMALASLGLAHYQLKQYDEALRVYQRVSAIQPDDPMPFEKIARIYERTGMLQEAVQSFMQGAESQLKAHDVERAVDDFNNAIRLNPENQTVHTRLAMIYDKLGRKDDAVNEYLATASLMQNGGEKTKALQVIQYTLQLAPQNSYARKALEMLQQNQSLPQPEHRKGSTGPVRMAQVRQMEGSNDFEDADAPSHYDPITETRLKALKEMATLLFDQTEDTSDGSAPINRKGIHALTRGTGGLSPEMAERARIQLHLSQAIDSQTSGQDEQAAAELENAISLGLNQSASYYVIGLLLRKKNPEKALAYLQKSVKNPNYSLGSYLLMSELEEKDSNYPDAALHALQALKIADSETTPYDQQDAVVQLYEPIIEAESRVTDEKDLRKLYHIINEQLMRPDWREYLMAARRQLPPQPEGSPPLPLAELLLETNSSQVVEAMIHIHQLASEGKYRTAMEEAYHALSYAPLYLPLHVEMAEVLISEGRIMEAVEKFLLVANAYNIRGETLQAINLLRRVTRLAPMDLSVRGMLIDLLKSIGRLDDAIQQYMDLANIYYLLAELDLSRQTYQSALALSQQSSSTRQWAIQILNKLADIELQSLDWKQAIRIFEQLRSLQPQDPAPRATLIDLHLQMGANVAAMSELDSYLKIMAGPENSTKRIHFIEKLLEDRPGEAGLQKRLVEFYLEQGQTPKAIEKLDALAEKLLKEENKANALATIQNIIDLNPPNSAEYQKLYNELSLK
ncbi:MAG: tetratricopeptide repeat protein [Anaerolineaceae bacterium]|jgi:tetratricopeptide (TPR) repeat protein|nr:tetratricopeptide repeat protein [Anaerolineaceae bacterium]